MMKILAESSSQAGEWGCDCTATVQQIAAIMRPTIYHDGSILQEVNITKNKMSVNWTLVYQNWPLLTSYPCLISSHDGFSPVQETN